MTPGKLHINDDLITSLNFEGIPKIISAYSWGTLFYKYSF